jgi:hypothetical protein
MSGEANIFTDQFRMDLPERVKDFISEHQVDIVFKQAATSELADGNRKQVWDYSFVKLTKNLKLLCNPPITNGKKKLANLNDVCYMYHNKHRHADDKRDWGQRNVRRGRVSTIGERYLNNNITNALDHEDFDFIVLTSKLDEGKRKIKKNAKTVGFLISQLGECNDRGNKYREIPALNLICAPKKHKCNSASPFCQQNGCGVVSRILMFMYLYALKKKNIKYGILELAGNYCNVGGLCLYNKFGFREDISIKDYVSEDMQCFAEQGTLSMICDLETITFDQLENALIKNENIDMPNSEPLCRKSNLTLPEQNIVLDRRMENFNNIMKLQQGRVELKDIKDQHFKKNGVPRKRADAVKELSKESQDGAAFEKFTRKKKKTKLTARSTRRAALRQTRNSTNIGPIKNYKKHLRKGKVVTKKAKRSLDTIPETMFDESA